MSDRDAVLAVMREWADATEVRDAGRLADLFAHDGRLHFIYHESIVGREAIRAAFQGVFDTVETGPWVADYHTVEVYGDRAHIIGDFEETQHPGDGSPGRAVHGRAIFLFRRDPDEGWLIEHGVSHRRAQDSPLD